MDKYTDLSEKITGEVKEVLKKVEPAEVDLLIDEVLKAEKVFIFGVGRVFLALKCFGKRLGQLGFDCQVVGSVTEKPITPEDLLIIASGSGESKLPVEIARIAKEKGARLGIITSAKTSTLKKLADFSVHLPCPTKTDPAYGVKSIQSMTVLFDQSLHIFGDVVATLLQAKKGLKNEVMWRFHANLE